MSFLPEAEFNGSSAYTLALPYFRETESEHSMSTELSEKGSVSVRVRNEILYNDIE